MKLDPTATNEKSDFPLLEEGDYEFQVANAKYQQSTKGNMQWVLQLRIDKPDGNWAYVWEYFPETESNQWKFNQFFKSIGKFGVKDTGEMKNVLSEIGNAHIIIKKQEGYKDKNAVKYFIEQKEPEKAAISDEDLPF